MADKTIFTGTWMGRAGQSSVYNPKTKKWNKTGNTRLRWHLRRWTDTGETTLTCVKGDGRTIEFANGETIWTEQPDGSRVSGGFTQLHEVDLDRTADFRHARVAAHYTIDAFNDDGLAIS